MLIQISISLQLVPINYCQIIVHLKSEWELAKDSEIFDIENTGKASQEELESEDSWGLGEGLVLADVVALGREDTEEDAWKILHHFLPTLLLLPL